MKVAQKNKNELRNKLKILWEEFKLYYSNHKERFFVGLLFSMISLGAVVYCIQNMSHSERTIPSILFWAYMSLWLVNKVINDLLYALGVDK